MLIEILFVEDNDCAIFIQISGLFKRQRLKTCSLRCTCPETGGSLTALNRTLKHLQLSTDNKNLIYCYKTLAYSDGTSFKRSMKPSHWRAQGGVYGK